MHVPNASIFRAYDIRGVVGENLTAMDFLSIGQAFASHVGDRCQCRTPLIVVMRDGRESSPGLMEAMIEGLMHAGARVLDAGVGPTPMCYFASHHLAADGAVMITGSHNPAHHNGAKFICDGKSLSGEKLASLRHRIADGNVLHSRGQREEVDILDEYVFELGKVTGDGRLLNQVAVAWDAGNGIAGMVIEELLATAKAAHIPLFLENDGTFPNHHPDPSVPANLAALQHAVGDNDGTALGVAFDGDGDRLGVVDDLGRIVSPDHLLMLLADDTLARSPGALIIGDVKTSDRFFERVIAHKGEALMWKTGHAHIKTKMAETGAKFAGEASGHLFFADEYYGFDDGIYAALRLIRLVQQSGKKLSALVDALPVLHTSPEMRIPCDDARKFDIIAALQQQFPETVPLDGVRVSTPDGWWLVRASNTQAVLTARAESNNPTGLAKVMQAMHAALAENGISIE